MQGRKNLSGGMPQAQRQIQPQIMPGMQPVNHFMMNMPRPGMS